jgi:outer membrane protein TolC
MDGSRRKPQFTIGKCAAGFAVLALVCCAAIALPLSAQERAGQRPVMTFSPYHEAGEWLPPLTVSTQPERLLQQPLSPQGRGEVDSALRLETVRAEVLARNPSLTEMIAAWEAASARYPQAIALDDPMFGAIIGPASFGSREVEGAYRLEISQKFPFAGKRALRGQNARAEASAAASDVDDMRLQLLESASFAYFDFYLVERALEVNAESLELLNRFRENAQARYKLGVAPQADVEQALVEIGRQKERLFVLQRMRQVAIARLNTLMHRSPDAPLPSPFAKLEPGGPLSPVEWLRKTALARRPDLQALAQRINAEQATLGLARKEFFPDVEVMAAYDAFWQPRERDLRPMLGVRVNLPVYTGRRYAAVSEAAAKVAQLQARLLRQVDQVNFEVQQAYEQVRESEQAVRLYQKEILPAARANVKTTESAYINNKVPFVSLIEAQRSFIMIKERSYEAEADWFRRLATLERAVGGPIPPANPTPPRPVTPNPPPGLQQSAQPSLAPRPPVAAPAGRLAAPNHSVLPGGTRPLQIQ